jgi:hypothetical protein
MTAPPAQRTFDWELAGHALGEKLDDYNAVVVAGLDPVATGRVALALARAQSRHRRVAVGDLFADSPPIQELVQSEDPHGIVDSFQYGVSLTKIAQQVPNAGQLFVMATGTEPPTYEEILPNPRWHRLSAGFREVGALLLLAVPACAPHIDALISATDGAIIVGDVGTSDIPEARVIGAVREAQERATVPYGRPPVSASQISRREFAAFGGIALTIVATLVAAWLAYRPLAGRLLTRPDPDCTALAASGRPCTPRSGEPTVAMTPDSAHGEALHDPVKAPAVVPRVRMVVANPGDSAASAAFAVQLKYENMQAGAILKLQQDGKNLPAATFSPVIIKGVRWYKVVSGASATASGADSLLGRLRQRKLMNDGSIVRLPFAFRIDSGVPASAVPGMVANYVDHGQPVYALRQSDGTAWLLIGAYESPEQSSLYLESLPSGTRPVLVYRKGRPF